MLCLAEIDGIALRVSHTFRFAFSLNITNKLTSGIFNIFIFFSEFAVNFTPGVCIISYSTGPLCITDAIVKHPRFIRPIRDSGGFRVVKFLKPSLQIVIKVQMLLIFSKKYNSLTPSLVQNATTQCAEL